MIPKVSAVWSKSTCRRPAPNWRCHACTRGRVQRRDCARPDKCAAGVHSALRRAVGGRRVAQAPAAVETAALPPDALTLSLALTNPSPRVSQRQSGEPSGGGVAHSPRRPHRLRARACACLPGLCEPLPWPRLNHKPALRTASSAAALCGARPASLIGPRRASRMPAVRLACCTMLLGARARARGGRRDWSEQGPA